MVAPWASSSLRVIASPSPVPFAFEVKNGLKIRAVVSASMPGPLSFTRAQTSFPPRFSPSAISSVGLGVFASTHASIALPTRLMNTRRSCSGSPTSSPGVSKSRRTFTRARVEPLAHRLERALDRVRELHRPRVHLLLARVAQQVGDRLLDPVELLQGDVRVLDVLGRAGILAELLHQALGRGDRVADLVRDRRRQLLERAQLLVLEHDPLARHAARDLALDFDPHPLLAEARRDDHLERVRGEADAPAQPDDRRDERALGHEQEEHDHEDVRDQVLEELDLVLGDPVRLFLGSELAAAPARTAPLADLLARLAQPAAHLVARLVHARGGRRRAPRGARGGPCLGPAGSSRAGRGGGASATSPNHPNRGACASLRRGPARRTERPARGRAVRCGL